MFQEGRISLTLTRAYFFSSGQQEIKENETPLNVKTTIARARFSRTDFDFSLFKGS